MRTIRFEILRHGPAHNQLLSPLTEYMALCENHQPVTVRLPFEHSEFLVRVQRLQDYADLDVGSRSTDLDDVARHMTGILAQVPALIRQLADESNPQQLFHVRLILSANELALLPFEIANASFGLASEGQPLLLQPESRVCITRESRRVASPDTTWMPQENPRVLLAAASPRSPIPLRSHLLALRRALQPWVAETEVEQQKQHRIAEHLKLLPQATLAQIERECASGQYTHVHILAHGVPLTKGSDRRFGLELHDSSRPSRSHVVEGTFLAKALRPPLRSIDETGFARPAVVTLAACDTGNMGSTVGAGASIAHSLHEEGIPLVIGSQFPLSFRGSVVMAKVLYEGLLWGEDPRALLVNLRRQLRTASSDTHDWASIVAYAAFPRDIDEQLARMRINQALRSLEIARNSADLRLVARKLDLGPERKRLKEARDRISCELRTYLPNNSWVHGRLASSEKRLAEVLWRMSGDTPAARIEVGETLRSARDHYRKAFNVQAAYTWALVQELVLTAVLESSNPADCISADQWNLARILSKQETQTGDRRRIAWAQANLTELHLLRRFIRGHQVSDEETKTKTELHIERFMKVAGPGSAERLDTMRQLTRYETFFAQMNPRLREIVPQSSSLASRLSQ